MIFLFSRHSVAPVVIGLVKRMLFFTGHLTNTRRWIGHCVVGFCFTMASALIAAEPPITSLVFDPAGRSLLAASQSYITVYEWPTLMSKRKLSSSLVSIQSLAFSPDGQKLAVAGGTPAEKGVVEIRSWPNGALLTTINGHDDTVQSVAWFDNENFATGSLDHEIGICRVGQNQPIRRFKGHSRGVTAIQVIADGSLLVSASLDQNIRVWKVETGELIKTLNNHTRAVNALKLRPVDHEQVPELSTLPMLASVSDDRTVRLWQPTIGRLVRFCRLDVIPLAMTWSRQGDRLAVACDDGIVRVIDPDTMETTGTISVSDSWLYAIQIHPTDGSLAVGSREQQLQRLTKKELTEN
ncbi:WD40 repeat domain-containing protein [bacterium]|nr:WD40 repeat domain-containing protein [bacterium]MDA7873938.1 WD40 repeat domain-containing protein [Rhodopirellula sp.]MDB4416452.1 WD40 repeat domain-containing protein [bacterium]MDB4423084.1 WD40 repeat domain-containing protein [Rhodopirellula sp.]